MEEMEKDRPKADVPSKLKLYMEGLRTHNLSFIGDSFADDIVFVTPVKTMQRDQILAFLGALYRGFPDWSFDVS